MMLPCATLVLNVKFALSSSFGASQTEVSSYICNVIRLLALGFEYLYYNNSVFSFFYSLSPAPLIQFGTFLVTVSRKLQI